MGKTKLNEIDTFGISIIRKSLDTSTNIEIPFLRVSVTIEPGRSLLRYHELFYYIVLYMFYGLCFRLLC